MCTGLTNYIFLALLQGYFHLGGKPFDERNYFHLHLCITSTYSIIWQEEIFKNTKVNERNYLLQHIRHTAFQKNSLLNYDQMTLLHLYHMILKQQLILGNQEEGYHSEEGVSTVAMRHEAKKLTYLGISEGLALVI